MESVFLRLVTCSDVCDAQDAICEFLAFALEDGKNLPLLLPEIEHMLDPGRCLFVHSLKEIPSEKLPLYYLFPGCTVIYKDENYSVVSIEEKTITIRKSSVDQGECVAVELTNKNLSVPRQFFHTHFASWVNSLVVGEVIDVAVARPSYTWTRGIISSITRNDNGIQSIRVTYSESQSLPDGLSVSEEKELVIDEFNEKTLNREFLRSNTLSEGLLPFRYVFPQNSLIPAVNRSVSKHTGKAAEVYGLMRAPPLFISMLNAISMNNLWYSVCQCIDDVSVDRRTNS